MSTAPPHRYPPPALSSPVSAQPRIDAGREIRTGLVAAVLLVSAGALLGLVWALLVPHIGVFRNKVSLTAPNYLVPNASEDRAVPGGDLVMLAVLGVTGLLAGVIGFVAGRRAPVGMIVGLVVGGAVGGLIAMAVGHLLVHGDYTALYAHPLDGTVFQVRPYVRGPVDFLVLPLVAAVVYLLAGLPALFRGDGSGAISSGTAGSGSTPAPEPPPWS